MNYSEITKVFNDTSIFDLWRIRCVISTMMEESDKICQVKIQLTPDMAISYFDAKENRLIEATVIKINRTQVLV